MTQFTISIRSAIVLVVTLLGGCATVADRAERPHDNATFMVYLIQDDWHTALLLDGPAILSRSDKLGRDFSGHRYIVVGWGDGEYFVEDRPGWKQAVKAMVASEYPALQVFGSDSNPPASMAQQAGVPLVVTARGYQQLAAYIDRTIAVDGGGKPMYLGKQQPNWNVYYRATGSYGLFNNCNSWVVGALRAAEVPISGWNLTARSVMEQAERISKQQAGPLARLQPE